MVLIVDPRGERVKGKCHGFPAREGTILLSHNVKNVAESAEEANRIIGTMSAMNPTLHVFRKVCGVIFDF